MSFAPASVMQVAECDYREFALKADFLKVRNTLVNALEGLLDDPAIKRPICIMGHNLTLGKNCALSAAFAQCALKHASSETMRFFSVIHDLAEEGRADCLSRIDAVRRLGIDIGNFLYPSGKNIRYCTPNHRNAKLLGKAGFHVRLLINPVDAPVKAGERQARNNGDVKKRLLLKAKTGEAKFDDRLPILMYPCRCIARKNILEAILLTTIVCKANLLLGAPGNSPGDKKMFEKTKKLCDKLRLPVVFDCERAVKSAGSIRGFPHDFYPIADSCLSTSITEGFGYALYEPWLYQKAVFGRKPLGFKAAGGVVFTDLYQSLPVPATWISVPQLTAKYRASMQACYGRVKAVARFLDSKEFDGEFQSHFVKNGRIDFGCLDWTTQYGILSDLVQSQAKAEEWNTKCGKELSAVRKACEKSLRPNNPVVRYNMQCISKNLSIEAVSKRFIHYINAPFPAIKPKSDCLAADRLTLLRRPDGAHAAFAKLLKEFVTAYSVAGLLARRCGAKGDGYGFLG